MPAAIDWELEGLDLRSEMKSWRMKTCSKLLDQLKMGKYVLVRSSPFSGKSSLAALFSNFVKNYFQRIISIIPLRNEMNEYNLEYTLKNEIGLKSMELLEPSGKSEETANSTLLIIDEVQTTYKGNDDFWENIKLHAKNYKFFFVLCFAAYGSNVPDTSETTPFFFNYFFGMDLMRLEDDEYAEFITGYLKSVQGMSQFR